MIWSVDFPFDPPRSCTFSRCRTALYQCGKARFAQPARPSEPNLIALSSRAISCGVEVIMKARASPHHRLVDVDRSIPINRTMNLLHHLGKLKTHVNINVTILVASNLGSFVRQDDVVHCCCRRKAKEFRSRIALAESDGSVPFNEEICFAATLYSSGRSKEFDEKIFSIALVNVEPIYCC